MARPAHFEIHAADPQRAIGFYKEVFGWTFTAMPMGPSTYYLIETGGPDEPGINGGMVQRMGPNPDPQDPTPVIAYVCTINVDDLDACMAKAVGMGSVIALPKMPVPGVGWLAYIKDTESNIIGLMQRDPAAA